MPMSWAIVWSVADVTWLTVEWACWVRPWRLFEISLGVARSVSVEHWPSGVTSDQGMPTRRPSLFEEPTGKADPAS